MRKSRGWLALLVLAALAPVALAQSGGTQAAGMQAQSLFDDGQRLRSAGKLAEACAAFEASQKLDPAITTLLNLADCREKNNQLATAWGAFVDANRMARAAGNDKLARVATDHAKKLEPRLSRLTIAVPADRQVPHLEVVRDGEAVHPASWNHALPIDGGTYTLTARAPGRTPWSVTRVVGAERDNQTIDVPRLEQVNAAPPPAVARAAPRPAAPSAEPGGAVPTAVAAAPRTPEPSAVAPAPKPAESKPADAKPAAPRPVAATRGAAAADRSREPAPGAGRSRMWPIALGAGALVLGGGAIALKISGDHTYDDALAANHLGNDTQAGSLHDSANARAYLAEALGIAALGCAGVAVYLYVSGRGEAASQTTAIVPIASPQIAGFAVVSHW